ncbi:MAG: hypothetical protein LBU35_01410, partial [Holosporales bacterium]|nr:hypothetical protein [Holosporales bacterium]
MTRKIGILGAGAFGTALSISYSKDYQVSLYSGFEDHVKSMKETRRNEFFEEFQIPDNVNIDVVDNLEKNAFDYIFWGFPVKPSVEILNSLKNIINGSNIVICSKGLDNNGGFLFESFKKLLPDSKIGYLSGPNFAVELAEYKLSMADIALENSSDS